ncbi:MAG: hypothetical protein IPK03_03360 [Bacteroidetes bacterium]|nr:hypothetical protein [Bacteroidota bacterium]
MPNKHWDNYGKPIFIAKLKLWKSFYMSLVKLARESDENFIYLISLKVLIEIDKKFAMNYSTQEIDIHNKVIKELITEFNPDTFLNKLEDTLLCIKFSEDSHFSNIYKEQICGKYLGLVLNEEANMQAKESVGGDN